jgi:hypothetical protein
VPVAPSRRKASPGAQAVVVAGLVALVTSAVFFPLAIVIAAVSGVVSVRHLRAGSLDRRWWTAGVVVAVLALLLSLFGAWVVLSR